MTKFYNFVNETFVNKIEDEKEFINLVVRDCKPVIKIMIKNKNMLFRGMKSKSIYSYNSVRKDRKPKDTPIKMADLLDKAFFKIFHWKPRSEGLFTTSNIYTASKYGSLNAVFPCGNFDYVWSPKVQDFFLSKTIIQRRDETRYPH